MLSKSKVKYIQTLGQKKLRQQEGLFIAEGPKLVKELLEESNVQIVEIFALHDWIEANKKLLHSITCQEINEIELEKISQLTTPNKVLALVKEFDNKKEINTKGRITLALDNIQDPGNMGTIIRIADWFGIEQIICNMDAADIYNSKVVQATMGSIGRVSVIYTNLPEWLSKQKVKIYCAALEGKDITSIKKIAEGIIVIGNEAKGISAEIMELATDKITISKKARLNDSVGQGKAESLNAAVACGIILSHLV